MPRSVRERMVLIVSALLISAFVISFLHSGSNINARIETSSITPQAFFTSSNDGATVHFLDQSRGVNLKAWSWDFGDGTKSSERSPSHAYAQLGNYTVRLTITDAEGRTSEYHSIVWVSSMEASSIPLWVVIPLLLMVAAVFGLFFIPFLPARIGMIFLLFLSLLWFASSGVLGFASALAVML